MAIALALAADALLVLLQRAADAVGAARAGAMNDFVEAFKFIGRNGQIPASRTCRRSCTSRSRR